METSKVNVYLVGPKGSVAANSFELMTNSLPEAQKALEALEEGEMKTIVVKGSKGA
jgi:hypothetical protein